MPHGTLVSMLSVVVAVYIHYENMPIQIYRKFHIQKLKMFRQKNSDILHIFALYIDCEYSLEPPRRGGSNEYHNLCFWAEIRKIMYTPVNPSFTIKKWGLRGSILYRRVSVMESVTHGNVLKSFANSESPDHLHIMIV